MSSFALSTVCFAYHDEKNLSSAIRPIVKTSIQSLSLSIPKINLPRRIGAGTLELTIHYREILMACFPRGHRPAAMNVFCPGVHSQKQLDFRVPLKFLHRNILTVDRNFPRRKTHKRDNCGFLFFDSTNSFVKQPRHDRH